MTTHPTLPVVVDAAMDEIVQLLGPRFTRSESRQRCRSYLQGLVSQIERKNGWQLAEAAGDRTPDAMQDFLKRSNWNPDLVRDDGVLIIDETGFLKKGEKSVGVQRQYSGTAGRIENCQIGVFLAYSSKYGRVFLDRQIYMPQCWCDNPERKQEAGVPDSVAFATKPQRGRMLLERAFERSVPARWVTADEVYGKDYHVRFSIEERNLGYVVAVPCSQRVGFSRADTVAKKFDETQWRRLSAGDGSKGPRYYDWAYTRIPSPKERWERGLLIRRNMKNPDELAYYLTSAPEGTSLETLVHVAGKRWAIELCFEAAKNEVGLDQYEVRSWIGWYRHMTLSLFAHAYVTVVKNHVSEKKMPYRQRKSQRRTLAVNGTGSSALDLETRMAASRAGGTG